MSETTARAAWVEELAAVAPRAFAYLEALGVDDPAAFALVGLAFAQGYQRGVASGEPGRRLAEGQASACAGKDGFESFKLAEKTARRVRRRTGHPVHVFKCRVCPMFHLGTGPTKIVRR